MKVCAEPGCPNLTPTGPRCLGHRQVYERARGTRQERGYGAEWQKVRRQVLDRDNWLCRLQLADCQTHASTVDHVVSKAKGGSDDPSNLVAACWHCNRSKGGR